MKNRVWFNEDGDIVYGDKLVIGNKEEFRKQVKEEYFNQTGESCSVTNIKEDVYVLTTEKLNGEWCYRFKDSGIEIRTLYVADVEEINE